LSTGFYYVYRVNDNTIKLSETYLDSKTIPPTTVSIAGTGGSSQSISLINPQIESIKNNNLVFNLSDSSLVGYKFKLYYDQNYNNEFISTPSSNLFVLSGIETIGVSTNASLAINYSESLPTKLYYNLHADYKYFINIDEKTILQQRFDRFFTRLLADDRAKKDLTENNEKFLKLTIGNVKNVCSKKVLGKEINKFATNYKKQKYTFASSQGFSLKKLLNNQS
jgi:hypothetical protein